MKTLRLLTTACLFFCISHTAFSQAGQWTWLKGSNTNGALAVFGTQGVEAAGNTPPALYQPSAWTDTAGNFWLFGGYDPVPNYWGDLWKYNPITNNWTWMKGKGTANATAVQGTMGVPSLNNLPSARGLSSATWIDKNGDFWMYSGKGPLGGTSDMWRYNIASNTWTWMQGTPAATNPVFGTQGIEAPSNNPGSRYKCQANWVDTAGNLWLYGGTNDGLGGSKYFGQYLGDLWKYNTSTNYWTWMGGNSVDSPEVYGVKGVASNSNFPGCRSVYSSWTDANQNFWMFGGDHLRPTEVGLLVHNDMWLYQPSTGQWTWMSGDSAVDSPGNYGLPCNCDTGLVASARYDNLARWKDKNGSFWFYGGIGTNLAYSALYYYSDLWSFNPVSQKWLLANGGSTSGVLPVYGTKGTAAPANTPGGRGGTVSWYSKSGELYLFGGDVDGQTTGVTQWYYNDVWKFTVDTACGGLAPAAINLGADTDYCGAFTRVLSAGGQNALWSTGTVAQQITVTQPGVYWASIAGCGAVASDTISIGITNLGLPFNLGADTNYCGNFSRTLSTGNAATVWSTGATASQITVTQPGTYFATLSNGCGMLTDTVQIGQSNLTLQLDTVSASCGHNTGSVTAIASGGATPYVYIWSVAGSNDSINNLTAGTYQVTITDNAGCSISGSAQVSASSALLLQTDSVNTTCGLNNGKVWTTPFTGTAPYTYSWNTGGTSDTLTNLTAGPYAVTVKDQTGCSASASTSVNTSSVNSVQIQATDSSFCAGDSTSICAPSGYQAYSWSNGGNTFCIHVTDAGNYYVTVTEPGGCSVTSNHVSINILSPPSVSTTVRGDTLAAYDAAAYQWYFEGTLLPGATDSVFVASQAGTYTVKVTAANGCSTISNGLVVTGINNLQNVAGLKLYPDPVDGELNISYTLLQAVNLQIAVTDLTGRRIMNLTEVKELAGEYKRRINVALLPAGVYILNFICGDGAVNRRFVKD